MVTVLIHLCYHKIISNNTFAKIMSPHRPRLSDSGNEGVVRFALVAHHTKKYTPHAASLPKGNFWLCFLKLVASYFHVLEAPISSK